MRMITACFARALKGWTSRICVHFLLTFQEVMSISKTRNQLRVKSAECPTNVKDNRVSDGTACNVELRQGGVAADEESVPDAWTDLAQGDTQLRETGQFRWLVHGRSVAQCAVSLKVSPRN